MKRYYKKIIGFVLVCSLVIGFMAFQRFNSKAGNGASATLLNTYGSLLGNSGTCVNSWDLKNANTIKQLKTQYNSITLENEMKPDAVLGSSPKLISKSSASSQGYYVPSSCTEANLPQLNFSSIDAVLKICYENGIKVRAHTLVWHSQTPDWFFRTGYSTRNGYVSQNQMNARMEYYIKSVMKHVYSGKYGSIVYAWDVVNEYLHASNSGWLKIYGNVSTSPAFVKRAFQYANESLKQYGLANSVSLFYNDYNTYMEVNNVIKLINYINSSGKICNGIGMQSHLKTSYPSVSYYTDALKAFAKAGFEIQITELDVVNNSNNDQANYMYNLMKNILSVKKSGGKITGITYWGLSDSVTWIRGQKPLLFSTLGNAKPSYSRVLAAYTDSGYAIGSKSNNSSNTNNSGNSNNSSNTNNSGNSNNSSNTNNSGNSNNSSNTNKSTASPSTNYASLNNGWYFIKNINAQKYLQLASNSGSKGVNVVIGKGTGSDSQKWYLTNTGNGYITLKNRLGCMLDLQYGKADNKTNIWTYTANGADAQKFKLLKTSTSGVYGIATKTTADKRALDVYNWGKSDGTNVCQWDYYGNANQIWKFEPCK